MSDTIPMTVPPSEPPAQAAPPPESVPTPASLAEQLARTQAALAVAEARVAGGSKRLLDAVQVAGLARGDIGRMAAESAWLRSLIDQAHADEAAHLAEVAWLRSVAETHRSGHEAALRQSVAQLQHAAMMAAAEATARADLQARLNQQGEELAALRASTSWRITAPLRSVRGVAPLRRGGSLAPPAALAITQVPPAAPPPAHLEASNEPPSPPAPPPQPAALPDAPAPPATPPPAGASPAPALVRTVHQFHAGSAVGDAITNAMLLIRAQLRAAGFRSDIFVAYRGPGLGSDIKLIDSLPDHDGYVLLLHHSMGFGDFDEIVALPARKVLIYHNITPPELLADVPRIQRQAEQGRAQLATLRSHVAFALADSDYNAIELQTLGYPAIRTCTLLFDAAAMVRREDTARPDGHVFTVLFVGRVTPSKAQDELVDAFAVFRRRLGQPCRLALVGALDPDEHAFLAAIQQRIAAAGAEDDVQLTGLVTERELGDWYRQADLYVSLSHHEGFSVPLVEALAHGIPVVAWPAGAVPFTLGGAGILLTSREPDEVAATMLRVVRGDIVPDQLPDLDRWSLRRHLPVLMEALAVAGAVGPPPSHGARAVAAAIHVTICGHVAKTYSLAAINRGLARTIEAQRPGSVRIIPVEGQPTTDLAEVPDEDRDFVQSLAHRSNKYRGPELVLSGHYPVYVPERRGDLLAALFFWEESRVPAETVATLNRSFDAVFAPSRFVAKALVDSGVGIPVLTIGQAPDLSRFAAVEAGARGNNRPFTFLHVSSAFPRKGLDVLLAAWVQAFSAADPVRLVIKTFPNPHNDAADQIARLRATHPGAAPIEHRDLDLPPADMVALYAGADAAVLPSRGEGYNLPAAEAMAAGIPVIVTAHGGHLDFCTPDTARLVARQFAPSGSHLAASTSLWAEPDQADLTAALREAAAGALTGHATAARRAILAQTDPAAFTDRLTSAAARLLTEPAARPVRLTWVTSWAVRCGIAAYSDSLLAAMPAEGLATPVVLADERTDPAAGATRAWRLGDESSVERLIAAIARADGDVTMIQHQPMLLDWPWLGRVVDSLADAGKPAIVTLHNTAHLLEIAAADRDATVRALRRAARILVHTLADVTRLDALGLADVTTLFAHPVAAPSVATIRTLSPGDAPVIGCTGFLLPDKGIPVLIAAVARLRARWPGIRLRLVNAQYDHALSVAEIAACRKLAAAEQLAVEWHTDFVSLDRQQELLRGCDVIALPYQQSKESSSAALRTALATGIPVAVTPLPLFDEAAGAVSRLPGLEAAQVELGLDALLADADRRTALAAAARVWMADRALPLVARNLHGMVLGLAAQARLGQAFDGALWCPPD